MFKSDKPKLIGFILIEHIMISVLQNNQAEMLNTFC